jgi:hypothetical protein
MRTRNLDEAMDTVSGVYRPQVTEIVGPALDISAVLGVSRAPSQPLLGLSYSTATMHEITVHDRSQR